MITKAQPKEQVDTTFILPSSVLLRCMIGAYNRHNSYLRCNSFRGIYAMQTKCILPCESRIEDTWHIIEDLVWSIHCQRQMSTWITRAGHNLFVQLRMFKYEFLFFYVFNILALFFQKEQRGGRLANNWLLFLL